MTTVASGRCTSDPGAVESAIGTKPSAATSPVIKTGRSLRSAATRTAVNGGIPSAKSCRTVDTRTMSASTETPDRAMKPTPADTLNGMSRSSSARTPPTAAKGTPVNTRSASRTRP